MKNFSLPAIVNPSALLIFLPWIKSKQFDLLNHSVVHVLPPLHCFLICTCLCISVSLQLCYNFDIIRSSSSSSSSCSTLKINYDRKLDVGRGKSSTARPVQLDHQNSFSNSAGSFRRRFERGGIGQTIPR